MRRGSLVSVESRARVDKGLCGVCERPRYVVVDGLRVRNPEWALTRRTWACTLGCALIFDREHKHHWGTVREEVMARDAYACQRCGYAVDRVKYPRCPRAHGLEVDHKVPIMLGGAEWDRTNLWTLCHDCHAAKTASEAKSYAAKRAGRYGSKTTQLTLDEVRK
mgnify:CR=1 FL=1